MNNPEDPTCLIGYVTRVTQNEGTRTGAAATVLATPQKPVTVHSAHAPRSVDLPD